MPSLVGVQCRLLWMVFRCMGVCVKEWLDYDLTDGGVGEARGGGAGGGLGGREGGREDG